MPEDVSVVGYDDLPPATAAGLTTVRSHQDALGAATAGALVGLIAGDESPRRVRVPVARATTSPAA